MWTLSVYNVIGVHSRNDPINSETLQSVKIISFKGTKCYRYSKYIKINVGNSEKEGSELPTEQNLEADIYQDINELEV